MRPVCACVWYLVLLQNFNDNTMPLFIGLPEREIRADQVEQRLARKGGKPKNKEDIKNVIVCVTVVQ